MSEKPVTINIRPDWQIPPPVAWYVDGFSLETNGEFLVAFFTGPGSASLCIAMHKSVLIRHRKTFLEYVATVNQSTPPTHRHASPKGDYISTIADIVALARSDHVGEIAFHAFPLKQAIDGSRIQPPEATNARCVALLRCSLELQSSWVMEAYGLIDSSS